MGTSPGRKVDACKPSDELFGTDIFGLDRLPYRTRRPFADGSDLGDECENDTREEAGYRIGIFKTRNVEREADHETDQELIVSKG